MPTTSANASGDALLRTVAARWSCPDCGRPLAPGAILTCPACGTAARLSAGGDAILPTGGPNQEVTR